MSRSFCGGDLLLPVVDCDQRFRLPMPSRKLPMFSTAKLAALERRREGGGVGLGGFVGSGSVLSLSEADRVTVTTDEDEMELERDDWRRCEGAGAGAGAGVASGL